MARQWLSSKSTDAANASSSSFVSANRPAALVADFLREVARAVEAWVRGGTSSAGRTNGASRIDARSSEHWAGLQHPPPSSRVEASIYWNFMGV